jgi:hypothetical protein
MKFQRKTRDIWELHVNYNYHGFEHELTEYSFLEIKKRRKEYQENCPQYTLKIIRKREKKGN